MSIKKYIPNILSTARLGIAVLILPYVFFNGSLLTTLIVYLVGDATDALDGFLARTWKVQSKYGKIVDPVADKTLNGLTLILLSLFINPMMRIVLAFEALIALITIRKFSNNKDISVSQIGRVKTVALFFTIISSFVSSTNPSLSLLTTFLIGATSSLQAVTTVNYIKKFFGSKGLDKETINLIEPIKEETNEKEIEKLKDAKEKLNSLSEKTKQQGVNKEENNEQIYEMINEQEPIIENKEDLGISRTLKK